MANISVPRGNAAEAVLPYLQYGFNDPTVVPTPGSPGMLYLLVPTNGQPSAPAGLYQKVVTEAVDTKWEKLSSGSSIADYKDPVDTINPIATNINLAAPGASINGVVMAVGMSFLVVNQTLPEENGIYDWNGPAVPATRRADANQDYEVTKGMFTWVNSGPTQRALTGWILTTANPITLGVTPLSFAQIPIAAGSATRIPNLFFVASNGTDANPSTRGAIASPFATIQAAINQAVAEGYGQGNQLTVCVMSKAATYAGFTTSPGINVTGFATNKFVPRVEHVNIVCDGAGINANTGCSISNLQFVSAVQPAVNFPAGNQGRWTINNCRILTATLGINALSMDNAGSVLNLENCDVESSVATPAINYIAGGNLRINGGNITSSDVCILNSAGILNLQGVRIQCNAATGYAIENFGSIQMMKDCRFDCGVGAGGFIARTGSFITAINNAIYVLAPAQNYEVELGATLRKSLLTLFGTSTTFLDNGTVETYPLTGVGYNPAVPANYPGAAPADMKPALDSLASMVNYRNARQVFVDALSGSDVTGTGAQLRPYQTITAALAAIALLPAGDYVLELASGDYAEPPIAWPSQASGRNVSINGSGTGCTISTAITLTSGAGANEQIVWQNVGITTNPVTFDLALAAIATIILNNGAFGVNRIDTLPGGPQNLRIFNSLITTVSTASVVLMVNCQWIGGPINVIAATGQLVLNSCLAAAMNYQVDGSMAVIASITSFSNFSGVGTLSMDATSKSFGPTVTTTTQVLADYSPTEFTFQPGGTDDFANRIFSSWASLHAQLQLVDGPKTVLFDDSIVTPAVIPAGAYSLSEVSFDNARKGRSCAVQVAAGVTWTGLVAINNLSVDFLNTAVVESLTQRAMFFEGTTINALGTAPIWEVPVGAQFQANKGTFFNGIPASPIVDVLAGQTFIMVLTQLSALNTVDCISGALTSILQVYLDASGSSSTQAAFAGTQSEVLVDNSSRVSYSPAVATDWTVVPTQVKQALDELAAKIGGAGFSENAYFVAENGSDVTGTGSYQKPFASIQAAINQAAADGHDFADPANILVMPSSVPYAGFTAQNGINVMGLGNDNRSVIVGAVDVTFDASGFATNSITVANLTITTGAARVVNVGAGNAGSLTINFCRLIQTGGFAAMLVNNAGAYVELDDCYVDGGGQTALQLALGSVSAWNTTYLISQASALLVQGGDFFGEYCSILSSSGGAAAVANQSGSCILQYCKVTNSSAAGASPAIDIDAGSVTAESCVLSAAGANENVDVAVGATFSHSLCTFAGASASFANAGTITTLGVFKMRPGKETITLDAGDIAAQFVDLAEEVTANSLALFWNFAQPPFEGDDYTLSTVAGVTRITFVPGGVLNTLAVAGQKLQANYLY